MKKLVCSILSAFLLSFGLFAQGELPPMDKSPMDMSYYPSNYPVLRVQDKPTGPVIARVIYSRPKKEGRVIFGGLVEYGKVWRLGANEATEIEFFHKVNIGGKKIQKGRYTLYALVNENSWTFIINRDIDTWGAFKYNPDKDVVRVDVPVEKIPDTLENFVMAFEKVDASGIRLTVAWENVKVGLPIKL